MKTVLIVALLLGGLYCVGLARWLAARQWIEHCAAERIRSEARGEEPRPHIDRQRPPLWLLIWSLVVALSFVGTFAGLPAVALWLTVRACRVQTATAFGWAALALYAAAYYIAEGVRTIRRNKRAARDAALHWYGAAYTDASTGERDLLERAALALDGRGQDGHPR